MKHEGLQVIYSHIILHTHVVVLLKNFHKKVENDSEMSKKQIVFKLTFRAARSSAINLSIKVQNLITLTLSHHHAYLTYSHFPHPTPSLNPHYKQTFDQVNERKTIYYRINDVDL